MMIAGIEPHMPNDALARTGKEQCVLRPMAPFAMMMKAHMRKPKTVEKEENESVEKQNRRYRRRQGRWTGTHRRWG